MNAKPAKDKFLNLMNDDNYLAQEKIDGVRALIYINKRGVAQVTTRGESVDNPGVPIDITHRIPCIKTWDIPEVLHGSILDCEITIRNHDSSQIAGIISYKSTVHIPEGLVFNCFDMIAWGGKTQFDRTYSMRDSTLRHYSMLFPEWIVIMPLAWGYDDKSLLLESLWAEGKEGIMLKNLESKYQPGKRPSSTWYKVKKVDSVDAKIVGSAPPEVYYRDPVTNKSDSTRMTKPYQQGWFGALVYELEDGTQGTVSGFDDTEKGQMSDGHHRVKSHLIGRYMELKFMEKTKDGKLRHPRFIRLREEVEK